MHGMNYYFECDRPQTLVERWLGVASYPGPSKGGRERAWYTGIACACARGPQKNMGWSDTIVYSIVHRTVHHPEPTNDHYVNTMEGDPSVCSVYQALSPLEGPGNEVRLGAASSTMVLQQWYTLLYLLVFYHFIHNSQSISALSP